MPNRPKQPGDAVLSRDGTVKVDGVAVGFWWVDGNDLYHFDFKRPKDPESEWGIFSDVFRHHFKAKLPQALKDAAKLLPE